MLGPKILFNNVTTRKFKERFIAVAVGGWNLLDPYSGDLPFIEVQIAVPNMYIAWSIKSLLFHGLDYPCRIIFFYLFISINSNTWKQE